MTRNYICCAAQDFVIKVEDYMSGQVRFLTQYDSTQAANPIYTL